MVGGIADADGASVIVVAAQASSVSVTDNARRRIVVSAMVDLQWSQGETSVVWYPPAPLNTPNGPVHTLLPAVCHPVTRH